MADYDRRGGGGGSSYNPKKRRYRGELELNFRWYQIYIQSFGSVLFSMKQSIARACLAASYKNRSARDLTTSNPLHHRS